MKIVEFILNYWSEIVVVLCAIILIVFAVIKFIKQPTSQKVKRIKEVLLSCCIEAEKIYSGSETGTAKLSYVFSIFCDKFPIISKFITVEYFNELVDNVLVEMRKLLSDNDALNKYVNGDYIEKESDKS